MLRRSFRGALAVRIRASGNHKLATAINIRYASSNNDPKNTDVNKEIVQSKTAMVANFVKSSAVYMVEVVSNPKETWHHIKKEAKHYWLGTKLLWVEIKMAKSIVTRLLQGFGMTRRERIQLIRTTMDIFRLVPFAIFVIVPFMEILLPVALKLFPNMLPSTFQDNLKKEESMKRELQMRLAVAGFMQETLAEMASKKKKASVKFKDGEDASGAKEVIDFIDKARLGEPLPKDSVIRIARLFKDELTLGNVARPQLVSMCQYMGLPQYGADAFLRFQLRTKLRAIKEDDRRILWEGIDVLTNQELREACQERGMQSVGLTQFGYKRQLQEWLDLSIQKSIPISLLIMSRAFMLTSSFSNSEDLLRSSISSLDSDTINEVVLANANVSESNSVDMQMRKMESIQFQRELIEEEREETEEAKQVRLTYLAAQESSTKLLAEPPAIAQIESSASTASLNTESVTPYVLGSVGTGDEKTFAAQEKAAKVSDHEDEDRKGLQLTLSEAEAISDLARGSAVGREKAEFAALKANLELEELMRNSRDGSSGGAGKENYKPRPKPSESVLLSDPSLWTSGETPEAATEDVSHGKEVVVEDETDKSVARMKDVLTAMLDKLQSKIDSTEKALGDSLNLLDLDKDGELTVAELKGAIKKILKRSISEEEAQEIVMLIDRNNDGKVSVRELLQYVESKKEREEVEALEAQIHAIKKKTAINDILERNVSVSEAKEICQMISADNGSVSVCDLRTYASDRHVEDEEPKSKLDKK